MRFIDYITTALRNIWRQKLRSILTIFAVVIGATSVTIMLALVTGAKGFFTSQFEASGALQQVIVTQATDLDYESAQWGGQNSKDGIKLTDDMAKKIQAIPHVTAVARTTSPYVFDRLEYDGKKYSFNSGVSAADTNGVVTHTVIAGRDFNASDSKNVILISKAYADKFGFAKKYDQVIGKKVTLVTNQYYTGEGAEITNPNTNPPKQGSDNKPPEQVPTTMEATVLGVMDEEGGGGGVAFTMDWSRALLTQRRYETTEADRKANETACQNPRVPCSQSQPKMTLVTTSQLDESGYSTFVVKVDETSNVEDVATKVRAFGIGASTAKQFMDQQIKIFNILGFILGGIGGIALLVAAIGVVNTMVMAILERTREIGVMRATGARRSTISRLFTFEAALLGFWGGVFGVICGFGLTRLANVFINRQLASNSVHANNIIGIPLWLALAVIGIGTLIGMLAGLYPAHRAAKLDPVEALRYE